MWYHNGLCRSTAGPSFENLLLILFDLSHLILFRNLSWQNEEDARRRREPAYEEVAAIGLVRLSKCLSVDMVCPVPTAGLPDPFTWFHQEPVLIASKTDR